MVLDDRAARRTSTSDKTTYVSKPLKFVDKKTGVPIDVNTDDHRYRGRVSIFEATSWPPTTPSSSSSTSTSAPTRSRRPAYDMGITSHLDAYPAEGLGGLTRRRLAAGDDARLRDDQQRRLAREADRDHEGRLPRRQRRRTLGKPRRIKVFSDGQTAEATKIDRGERRSAAPAPRRRSAARSAGKTGTTNDFVDAWFDGFTPSLNTTVWVGYPEATRLDERVHGCGAMFGGTARR